MKTVLSFIVSLILLIGLCFMGLQSLKPDPQTLILPEESGPQTIWYAQNLAEYGSPSINGEIPVVLTSDSLYVGLIRALLPLNLDASSLALLLGIVFSVSTLFILSRYANLLELSALESVFILVATITLPAMVPAILSGSSDALLSLLLTLAVITYFKKQHQSGYGFSFAVLMPIGVASALHLEALLLLIVLGIGNILCGLINKEKSPHVPGVFFDLLNGILLAGIFILPAVVYHLNTINVPWPRSPDAWLAIGGASTAVANDPGLLFSGYVAKAFNDLGVTQVWPGMILLPGLIGALILTVRRQSVTAIHYIVIILLAPVLAAGSAVFLGGEGAMAVMSGLMPVSFLLGSFVLCRAVQSLSPLKKIEMPVVGGMETGTLGLAVVLAIGFCIGVVSVQQAGNEMSRQISSLTGKVSEINQSAGSVGTDRPAWVRLYGDSRTVDVTGRMDSQTLSLIGAGYHLNAEGWSRLVQEREISTFLIVDEKVNAALVESGLVETESPEGPWLYSSLLP